MCFFGGSSRELTSSIGGGGGKCWKSSQLDSLADNSWQELSELAKTKKEIIPVQQVIFSRHNRYFTTHVCSVLLAY